MRAVLSISCDAALALRIKELAEKLNKSESALCAEALADYLKRLRDDGEKTDKQRFESRFR